MLGITLFVICVPTFAAVTKLGTEDVLYFPFYGRSDNQSDTFSGFARALFDAFKQQTNLNINELKLICGYENLPTTYWHLKLH